jgi:hypothetical protein
MNELNHPQYPSKEPEIQRKIRKPNLINQLVNSVKSGAERLIIEVGIQSGHGRLPHPEYPDQSQKIERDILDKNNTQVYPSYGSEQMDFAKQPKSKISIVNWDSDKLDHIELQWVPTTLSYKPESKLVALASIGRNNPFYHYGGSEDSLEFTIDWFFTNDLTREEALRKARWLESLSKSNGYNSGLDRVKLIWGDSGIFADSLWLVAEAPYEMSNWVDNGLKYSTLVKNKIDVHKFGLLPQSVIQNVLLKRVTSHNLTHQEIREVRFDFNNINP